MRDHLHTYKIEQFCSVVSLVPFGEHGFCIILYELVSTFAVIVRLFFCVLNVFFFLYLYSQRD